VKNRRKSDVCLNCGSDLSLEFNFCPKCGQENNNSQVSFAQLVREFFVNYFSLDSRLGNSIKPFLFKPGLLTNRFHDGKRLSFMNPVRLYIILSLFYFFVFTKAGQYLVRDKQIDPIIITRTESLDRIQGIDRDLQRKLNANFDSTELAYINPKLDEPTLYNFYTSLNDSQVTIIYPLLKEAGIDSAKIFDPDKMNIVSSGNTSFSVNKTESESFILNRIDFELLNRMIKDNRPDQAIYDSLKLGEITFMEDLVVRQLIRINKADEETVTAYILQNVPLMMFLLIPLFALILKLFYVRRKVLYIRHMVHAIHLHSFAYLIYGISIIFMFWVVGENASTFLGISAFLWVSVYSYISFRKVYKQGWFKTLVKFLLTGVVYLFLIWVFFIAELLTSALLF
jgi:hypothetical protein